MKNIFTLLLVFVVTVKGFSQNSNDQKDQPPFKLGAVLPNFKIMNVVDSTAFTTKNLQKGKKTIIIYFGPDCGHCTFFTKKLMDSIQYLENTQIVMVSSFEYGKVKKFYEDNKLSTVPFITVGTDNYFFVSYYGVRSFPSAYIYSKKGKFVKNYESEIAIKDLIETN